MNTIGVAHAGPRCAKPARFTELRKNECRGGPPCPSAAEALVPCGDFAIGGETQ
jgi:hypothetical protein